MLANDAGPVLLTVQRGARVFDYRDLDDKRMHRLMVTVPPKLRQNIARLCGVEDPTEVPISTLVIALADYAALVLRQEGRRLHVLPATDHHLENRRHLRQQIAERGVRRGKLRRDR